jgi:hypothetical protein
MFAFTSCSTSEERDAFNSEWVMGFATLNPSYGEPRDGSDHRAAARPTGIG